MMQQYRMLLATLGLMSMATHAAVYAQIITPNVVFVGSRPSSLHVTATEAWANCSIEDDREHRLASPAVQAHYPKDSMLAVAARRASAWVATLQRTPVKGVQLDPYGALFVSAHDEATAQAQIAARLATPNLSLADRSYTLWLATGLFANPTFPARLPIAERYLAQLDALGSGAVYWQMETRKALIYAYYRLGRSADVARVGTQAFALVGQMPFELRQRAAYLPSIDFTYAAVVDALSGQPNGKQTIQGMNTALLAAAEAPPAYVAHDSIFAWIGEMNRRHIQMGIALSERVGEPAAPMVANYWVNRGAARDSQMVAVNDGKIRVIEVGSFTCAPCMAALAGLERLHHQYPTVEFNLLTHGSVTWGNRIVPAKIQADHLAEHFLKDIGVTFPIGIAMPVWQKATDDSGDWTELTTETWHPGHYPQTGKPTFYIVDGKGIIRRILAGYNRDLESNLATIVEFLQQESKGIAPHA